MKRLLRKCCNTKLSRTVSHSFSFDWNYAAFSPKAGDSMFLFPETLIFTYEATGRHNPEE
jgi:hypothetical protein